MKKIYSGSIYSEISEFYHDLFPVDRSLIEYLFAAFPAGSVFLDMGCGNGQLAGALAERGNRVLGTDIDELMIENAAIMYPDAAFEVIHPDNYLGFIA